MRFLRSAQKLGRHLWRIGYEEQGSNYLPRMLLRYAGASTVMQPIF